VILFEFATVVIQSRQKRKVFEVTDGSVASCASVNSAQLPVPE